MHQHLQPWFEAAALAPALLMFVAAAGLRLQRRDDATVWPRLLLPAVLALACALLALGWQIGPDGAPAAAAGTPLLPGLASCRLAAWVAVLVQFLGLVISAFSARYLQGEPGQARYASALALVLASVQLLLLAGQWLVLIAAWALAAAALHRLLCFYPERPFALLAAHKKRLADRIADLLLLAAAALAWQATGSGSLDALGPYLARHAASPELQASAVLLVLAVLLRTALLPVHGWLVQVMEAPTPVSALLHAGVVNLGGYVLIRCAPLLDAVPAARWLLVAGGLATAVLAGLVSLTRISIKVRLAWSTVAQMGFMLLECGLGLYTLAALHLIGHSLYKAHAFLSASGAVRQSGLSALRGHPRPAPATLLAAPLASLAVLALLAAAHAPWPWWWSGVLALAWAPLLWLPARGTPRAPWLWQAGAALLTLIGLCAAAWLVHHLRLGVVSRPQGLSGLVALAGMGLLYACLAVSRWRPQALAGLRRWCYAGFYLDEAYTRVALWLWPARWGGGAARQARAAAATAMAAD